MSLLIFIRHGQSAWNLENRFTGNVDVDLTPQGEAEARNAGRLIRNYEFGEAHTSVLKRAIRTLSIVLEEAGKSVRIFETPALNERNYGDLQGLNKTEMEKKYGEKQVLSWRRGYEVVPPGGESLKDTVNRVVPYYKSNIEPKLIAGMNILIVAHGNSLRALMMYLEDLSATEIESIDIATGLPRLYEFDPSLSVVKSLYLI